MTIFERLAALQGEIDALKGAPAPDNSALEARVAALEAEVGTDPAQAPPAAPEAPQGA